MKMSQKRNPDDASTSGNYSPDDKRRRSTPTFKSVAQEVMRQNKFKLILEPMLRRVVKEEVESAINKHIVSFKRSLEDDALPSEPRSLQLKFLSILSLPVFTGTRIEGEDGSAIKIALVDLLTNEIVQYAPESSSKVEVVVLEGDFDSDERESWTLEEFKSNIVREREGKKPLLTGDVFVYLKDGTGSVSEISFTDNSSWTRSRRFRLGARVAGSCDGARIREAKTESFIVRDHRGELYKKHHPPSLIDEVWRLEKIGKDGAFHKRLSIERVKTVKDFLILLNLDPVRLRNVLGSGMSAKMWDVTIEHARTCVLDKRVFLYYSPSSQHKNGVVFNVVGQILGLYSESQFVLFDKLSESEKFDAQRMVTEGFQHWDGVISFEDMNSLIGVSSHATGSPMAQTPDANKLLTRINRLDYAQSSVSSPDMLSPLCSLGCLSSSDDFPLQSLDTLDLRYDQPLNSQVHISNSIFCSPGSIAQTFPDDDSIGFMDIDFPLNPLIQSATSSLESDGDLRSAFNAFLMSHSSPQTARGTPAHRRWRVLSSIFKWFSLRRRVVMRRTRLPAIQRFQ